MSDAVLRTGFAPGEVIAGPGVEKTHPPSGPLSTGGVNSPHVPAGVIRFKLDGAVKTVDTPVTGAQLHKLAGAIDGYPVTLDGVPDTNEPYPLHQDQELTTSQQPAKK